MITEEHLLAAILNSREAWSDLNGEPLSLSSFGAVVQHAADDYYAADTLAPCVDRTILRARLESHFPAPKMAASLLSYLDGIPTAVSVANVRQLARHLSAYKVGLDLADALTRAERQQARSLAEKYLELSADQQDALSDWKPRLTAEDYFGDNSTKPKIRVYPNRLNEVLHGGIRAGHACLIFGRPGSGKTLLTVNMVAGMAAAGHKILYVGNEEPLGTLQHRFLSRLGSERLWDLDSPDRAVARAAYERAEAKALRRGFGNVHLLHGAYGMRDLAPYIAKVKPDVLVIDQIRHMDSGKKGDDNLTYRLEAVCRQMRAMAHEHQLVAIGITQAGDRASGKGVLSMEDVDSAKTGVQGAVDLIIGVGVTDEMKRQNKRMLSLARNKLTGREEFFPIWIDEQHTRASGGPPQ